MITVDQIKALKTNYEITEYPLLRQNQSTDHDFYEMAFDTGIQEPYRSMRLVTSRRMIDVAVEHISMDNPVVLIDPLKTTKKAQEQADILESFGNALIQMLLLSEASPIIEIGKNLLIFGEVFVKILPPFDYPLKPERKKGESVEEFKYRTEMWEEQVSTLPPVKWEIVHPMNVYCSIPHKLHFPYHVIENYYRDYADIMAQYPNWKNPKSRKDGDQIAWFEYHSCESRYFEADGEAISNGVEPNILGIPPYVHFYSGFGKKSPAGYMGTSSKLELGQLRASLARSIIFPARDTIVAQSRVQSQLDSAIAMYTNPGIVTSLSEKELETIGFGPGKIMTSVPKDARFEVNSGIAPDAALFQHAINLSNELEKFLPSPVYGGIAGESGYQQAQAIGQGGLKYQILKETIQHCLAASLMLSFRVIKHLVRHDVILKGYDKKLEKPQVKQFQIKVDDLQDFVPLKVRLEPADPEFRDRRALIGMRGRKEGSISRLTELQDYWMRPNATEELTQIWAERIMEESPEIKQVIALKALEKLGMKEEADMIRKQQLEAKQAQESIRKTAGTPAVMSNQGRTRPVEQADLEIRKMQRLGGPQHTSPLGSAVEESRPL